MLSENKERMMKKNNSIDDLTELIYLKELIEIGTNINIREGRELK